MKKLRFRYDGKIQKFEESSHAALFRNFFAWWKKQDMEATLLGVFESGLRISNEDMFEGTVIKKKNLEIMEDVYIITHITPAAMDKGIWGFLEAVGADILEPKPPVKKGKFKPIAKTTDEDEDDNESDDQDEDEDDEPDYETQIEEVEVDEDELKKAAQKILSGKGKGGKVNMAELVQRHMMARDLRIKQRLAKGPQSNAK